MCNLRNMHRLRAAAGKKIDAVSTLFWNMATPHATAAERVLTLNSVAVTSLTSQVHKSLPRKVLGCDLKKCLRDVVGWRADMNHRRETPHRRSCT
jgi:hypothetical protein